MATSALTHPVLFAVSLGFLHECLGLVATNSCEPGIINITVWDGEIDQCSKPYDIITCQGLLSPRQFDLQSSLISLRETKGRQTVEFCSQNLRGQYGRHTTALYVSDSQSSPFEIPVVIYVVAVNGSLHLDNVTASLPEDASPGEWRLQINVSNPSWPDYWTTHSVTVYSEQMPPIFAFQKVEFANYLVYIGENASVDYNRDYMYDYYESSFDMYDYYESSFDMYPELRLDAEDPNSIQRFEFYVTATDDSMQESRAWFTITVQDVNDNPPHCEWGEDVDNFLDLYYTTMIHGRCIPLEQWCVDRDRTVENQIQYYELINQGSCDGTFTIDNKNLLCLTRPLERLPGPCQLELRVADPDFSLTVQLIVTLNGCHGERDMRMEGLYWEPANPGDTVSLPCPSPYNGTVSRNCSRDNVYLPPSYRCSDPAIAGLLDKVSEVTGGEHAAPEDQVQSILESLANITSDDSPLQEGDVLQSTAIINKIVDSMDTFSIPTVEIGLGVIDNLLASGNTRTWQSLIATEGGGAESLFETVDNIASIASRSLNNTGSAVQFSRTNLMVEFGDASQCDGDINFPDRESPSLLPWAKMSLDEIKLPCGNAGNGVRYSTAYYRNVSDIIPAKVGSGNGSSNASINAAVMSFTLYGQTPACLRSPIEITFQMFSQDYENPICSYWSQPPGSGSGFWGSEGCWVARRDSKTVVCACDHLTNFALLMSPGGATLPAIHQTALSVISVVGCSVSMVSLLLTIILHAVYWRLVKTDRAVLLMNLCAALLLAYTCFLAGVTRTESKAACTTVAVLLHFIYLVVFFLMLAEGVHLAMIILFVHMALHKKLGHWLLILAWGIPALIVAVSMATAQLHGYGNEDFCWLSTDSGLIWAFISPALFVIVLNAVIIVAVVRKMLQNAAMRSKSDREKAKASVFSICVLLPITGVAWVLGVFSVNSGLVAFQYAFALCNSTQGLFIFVFHCCLNKKIREGFKQTRSRWSICSSRPTTTSADSQPSSQAARSGTTTVSTV